MKKGMDMFSRFGVLELNIHNGFYYDIVQIPQRITTESSTKFMTAIQAVTAAKLYAATVLEIKEKGDERKKKDIPSLEVKALSAAAEACESYRDMMESAGISNYLGCFQSRTDAEEEEEEEEEEE